MLTKLAQCSADFVLELHTWQKHMRAHGGMVVTFQLMSVMLPCCLLAHVTGAVLGATSLVSCTLRRS